MCTFTKKQKSFLFFLSVILSFPLHSMKSCKRGRDCGLEQPLEVERLSKRRNHNIAALLTISESLDSLSGSELDSPESRSTLFHQAVERGDCGPIAQLSDIEGCKSYMNSLNEDGMTPLHCAIKSADVCGPLESQLSVINQLIECGVDTSVGDKHGWTALHYLACKGLVDELNRVILRRPEVNARANDGLTPLHCASMAGRPECVRVLIQKDADVCAQDSLAGWTALHHAAFAGHSNCVRILLEEKD